MGGPSLEGALALGEDAEMRSCGRGEAAHGMGVMSPTPGASTCPGIAPWPPTSCCVRGLCDTKGWQNPAGDTQSCLWERMVAPAAAHGHCLPLGMTSSGVPVGRLWLCWRWCWRGWEGTPRLCHPAVPGEGSLVSLSRSIHSEQPGGIWFSCCTRMWVLGRGGQRSTRAASTCPARPWKSPVQGWECSWDFLRAVGSGASPGITAVSDGAEERLILRSFLADTGTRSRSWKLNLT